MRDQQGTDTDRRTALVNLVIEGTKLDGDWQVTVTRPGVTGPSRTWRLASPASSRLVAGAIVAGLLANLERIVADPSLSMSVDAEGLDRSGVTLEQLPWAAVEAVTDRGMAVNHLVEVVTPTGDRDEILERIGSGLERCGFVSSS